jgi:hypothetical protein
MAFRDIIAALSVNLSIDSAELHTGATAAERRVEKMRGKFGAVAKGLAGFGAALVGSFAIGEIGSAISRGLEYASSLGEVAQQLGVTTSELQKYRYMASQVGLEQNEMDAGLAKLTRTMGEAQQGSKPIVDAFNRLGISVEELRGKSADEVMRMIADGLKGVADPAQRAAILVDLFGRAGQKLAPLLAGGSEGIDQLSEAYRKLGIEISPESIAKADDAKDKMAALKQVLEGRIAGVVAENAGAIVKFTDAVGVLAVALIRTVAKLGEWAGAIKQAGASTRIFVDGLIAAFTSMRDRALDAVTGLYNGVKSYLLDKLNVVMDAVRAKVKAVGDAFFQLWDRVVGHSYVPDMVDAIDSHFGRLGSVMVDPAISATDQTIQAFAGMAQNVIGSIDGIIGAIKRGDWLGAAGGVLGVLQQVGGLFGGKGVPATDFGRNPSTGPIGMARGGSFAVGGFGGTDRNLLSLNGVPVARVSRGEMIAVSPANNNGRGQMYFDLRGAVVTEDLLAQMNVLADGAAMRGALAGVSMSEQRMARRSRRRLG